MNVDLIVVILSVFLGLIMFAIVLVSTENKKFYFHIPAIVGICAIPLRITPFVITGYIAGGLIFCMAAHIRQCILRH